MLKPLFLVPYSLITNNNHVKNVTLEAGEAA